MTALSHVAFNSTDRNSLEKFYVNHFGFKRCKVFNAGQPNEIIVLKLGSMRLELFHASPEAKRCFPNEGDIGYSHLAFEVDSLEAAIKALNADGIKVGPVFDCSSAIPGFRVCFFKDPDGNSVEIMQGYRE